MHLKIKMREAHFLAYTATRNDGEKHVLNIGRVNESPEHPLIRLTDWLTREKTQCRARSHY